MMSELFEMLKGQVDGAPKMDTMYRPLLTIGEGKFAK
jgi:hypothetical protein